MEHAGQERRWGQDLAVEHPGRHCKPRAEELIGDALSAAPIACRLGRSRACLAADRDAHRNGDHPSSGGLIGLEEELDQVNGGTVCDATGEQPCKRSTYSPKHHRRSTAAHRCSRSMAAPIVSRARNRIGQHRVGRLDLLERRGRRTAGAIRMPLQRQPPPGAPQLSRSSSGRDAEQGVEIAVHGECTISLTRVRRRRQPSRPETTHRRLRGRGSFRLNELGFKPLRRMTESAKWLLKTTFLACSANPQ